MAQRLPTVGGDDGTWGTLLNDFLGKEHYDVTPGTPHADSGQHKTVTIKAGTATAGTAPLKFASGTVLGTPEVGAMEFNTDALYFTITTGPTRKTIAYTDMTVAATTTDALAIDVTGDTQKRIIVNGDGKLEWGSGALAVDTNLYRSAANTLKTDDSLSIAANLEVDDYMAAGNTSSLSSVAVTNIGHTFDSADNLVLGGYGIFSSVTADNPTNPNALTALYAKTNTAATSFTLGAAYGVYVASNTKGASSTITNNFGIRVEDQTTGDSDFGIAIDGADTQALWVSSGADNTDAANGIGFGLSRDTNLYRSAANTLKTDDNLIIAAAGTAANSAATIDATQSLTNKRLTPRITSISSSATPTINTDNCDAVTITALATDITSMTTNLSGTPTNFQKLIIRFKDDGTARAIAWGASFEAKGVALPTTTVISKVLTVGLIYDTVSAKWGCVASAQEA